MIIDGNVVGSYMTVNRSLDCIRYMESYLEPLKLNISFDLVATQESGDDLEVVIKQGHYALSKVLFWLETCLYDILIVQIGDKDGLTIASMSNNPVMHTPLPPTEDVICRLLHSKIDAILNGNLAIGDIKISSKAESVSYVFNAEYSEYGLPYEIDEFLAVKSYFDKPWWRRNDGFSMEFILPEGEEEELSSQYDEIEDPLKIFDKKYNEGMNDTEEKQAEIIEFEKWKPKLV